LPILDGLLNRGKWLDIGYYSQMHEELLVDKTIYENFEFHGLAYSRERLASILWHYGFSYHDVDMKVSSLSGWQRSKILFAILGQKWTNFLILDEPTNHLDYESREALETALRVYPGTILFISHDRYFVNKLATHIWIIEKQEMTISYGNYEDYQYKKERWLSYDMSLFDETGELNLVLEEKLWREEARRIRDKFARKRR
jgi:ATP-binding cassette subfamily F protein 3